MRFALLGYDHDVETLLKAILRSAEHEVTATYDVDSQQQAALNAIEPGLPIVATWEAMLSGSLPDAVVVGRGPASRDRFQQATLLLKADIPLAMSFPLSAASLPHYELELAREEHQTPLVANLWWRWHPAVEALRRLIAEPVEGSLGRLEQIVFQRSLPDATPSAVRLQLTRDFDVLGQLSGTLTHVSGMRPPGDTDWRNLGVQLTGPGGILVRWSSGPVKAGFQGEIAIQGENGSATLYLAESREWVLRTDLPGNGHHQEQTFSAWDRGEAALREIVDTLQSQPERAVASWRAACRAIELSEAVERSLLRGRTVEVRIEGYDDERGNFQATMTAVGCMLLLGGCLLGTFAAVLGAFRLDLVAWPYILAAFLSLFLLSQLLGWLIPKTPGGGKKASVNADRRQE